MLLFPESRLPDEGRVHLRRCFEEHRTSDRDPMRGSLPATYLQLVKLVASAFRSPGWVPSFCMAWPHYGGMFPLLVRHGSCHYREKPGLLQCSACREQGASS
jgi:hypothetical protein